MWYVVQSSVTVIVVEEWVSRVGIEKDWSLWISYSTIMTDTFAVPYPSFPWEYCNHNIDRARSPSDHMVWYFTTYRHSQSLYVFVGSVDGFYSLEKNEWTREKIQFRQLIHSIRLVSLQIYRLYLLRIFYIAHWEVIRSSLSQFLLLTFFLSRIS